MTTLRPDMAEDTGHADGIAPAEDLSAGVHRLLLASVDRAASRVSTGTDGGFHDARKALKRARALLRLIGKNAEGARYSGERTALRDAARVLGPARDSYVLMRTLEDVRERAPDGIHRPAFIPVAEALRRHHADEHDRLIADGLIPVMRALRAISRRIAANPPSGPGPSRSGADAVTTIGRGLRREYKRGRSWMEGVARAPSDENLHEWRKSVKYLRYQLEALEPRWPISTRASVAGLRVLGERLGEDHDLVLLTSAFEDTRISIDPSAHQALAAGIQRRRGHLQGEAATLAASLYVDSPREFAGQLEDHMRRAEIVR